MEMSYWYLQLSWLVTPVVTADSSYPFPVMLYPWHAQLPLARDLLQVLKLDPLTGCDPCWGRSIYCSPVCISLALLLEYKLKVIVSEWSRFQKDWTACICLGCFGEWEMIFVKTAGCCSVLCNLCRYQVSALENSRLSAWEAPEKKGWWFWRHNTAAVPCSSLSMLLSWGSEIKAGY